jgi:hypothetical protein
VIPIMSDNQIMKLKAISAKSAPKKARVTLRLKPALGPPWCRSVRPPFAFSFKLYVSQPHFLQPSPSGQMALRSAAL